VLLWGCSKVLSFEVNMPHHILWIYGSLVAAICMPLAAQAAINKCVGADGKVVFSDQACNTGQAATQIKAPVKPTATNSKPIMAAELPQEGAATPNSNLQQYDTLCAEDRRLLEIAASKVNVKDTITDQNLQHNRARVDKRCNPDARLAAHKKDQEAQVMDCKIRREELQSRKSRPKPPAGYADPAREIAISEAWLKANCDSAGR
jgi:hypothetical protein